MTTDYNNFSKTFSNSRKNMKWEEIEYFLSFLKWKQNLKILDIWCWNWRLLSHLKNKKINFEDYLWIDLSENLLEEFSILHPKSKSFHMDMLDLNNIKQSFNCIFFIASFHHLNNIDDRLSILKKAYEILDDGWNIFLTNWSLNSQINHEKYKKSIIKGSENQFWSLDYNIKIWEYTRYYHCFNLKELEYLFEQSWFQILENREFDNNKNFISIIKKIS